MSSPEEKSENNLEYNADGYTYGDYCKLLKYNEKQECKAQALWDKYVIALSSGGIVFAITFLRDNAIPPYLLILFLIVLVCWGLSLFFSVCSFYFAQRHFKAAAKHIRKTAWSEIKEGDTEFLVHSKYWKRIRQCNKWGFVSFILGLLLMILFTCIYYLFILIKK